MTFWRLAGAPSADEWAAFWAFLTFLVALSAFLIAYFDYYRSKRKDEDDRRPALVVDLAFSDKSIYLSVLNVGRATARECQITLAVESTGQTLIDKPVAYLAAGATLRLFVAPIEVGVEKLSDLRLRATAIFSGGRVEESYLALSDFTGAFVAREPLNDIAAALERLARRT